MVLPLCGPVAMSGAQFILTFILLRRMALEEFGQIAFLMVIQQFLLGCWSALFCAPLLVLTADGGHGSQRQGEALNGGALIAGGIAFLAMVPLACWLGLTLAGACAFAGFTALMLTRQYGRAWHLCHAGKGLAVASDLAFSGVILLFALALLAGATVAASQVAYGLFAAAALSTLAVAWPGRGAGWLRWTMASLPDYGAIWRRDSRWTMMGVVATELTANAHAYIVAALLGPTAFAPIAATALFIRPVVVVINPLSEFERVRMAQALAQNDVAQVRRQRWLMRSVVLATWLGTAAVAGVIQHVWPTVLLGHTFPPHLVSIATVLWFAVVLARAVHAPEGAVLQAGGVFRPLALLAVGTAAVSALAVMGFTLWGGAVWSMAGVILGEGAYALMLRRMANRFLADDARLVGTTR